jgi:hypothetical protein
MAKFLNKKERVYDLQLTSYGKYLMGIGKFKPTYYQFFDDNILYDARYAMYTGSNAPEKSRVELMLRENQNEVHKRIKEETQYLESLVVFEDVENNISKISEDNVFETDITATMREGRLDMFRIDEGIGDAYLNAGSDAAPAWKIVTLQGNINSSAYVDDRLDNNVPQINIELLYKKKTERYGIIRSPHTMQEITDATPSFADGHLIRLESDDALIYVEEVNTELLTQNFDIEVFDRTFSAPTHPSASITLNLQPAADDYIMLVTSNENYRSGDNYKYVFKSSDTSDARSARYVTIGADASATAEALFNKIELSLAGELGGTAGKDQSFHNVTYDGDATISLTLNNAGSIYNFNLNYIELGSSVSLASEATAGTFTIGGWSGGKDKSETLEKKFFRKQPTQVVNGFMIADRPIMAPARPSDTGSVEYYFNLLTDRQIDQETACRGASIFNRQSYYVDLDFHCSNAIQTETGVKYYDIYGAVTEPEICQD